MNNQKIPALDQVLWHATKKSLRGFELSCIEYSDSQAFISFQNIRLGTLRYLVGLNKYSTGFNSVNTTEELIKICKLNNIQNIKPEFNITAFEQGLADTLKSQSNIIGIAVVPERLGAFDQIFKNYHKAMLILKKHSTLSSRIDRMDSSRQVIQLPLAKGVRSREIKNELFHSPETYHVSTSEDNQGTQLRISLEPTEPDWIEFEARIKSFIDLRV